MLDHTPVRSRPLLGLLSAGLALAMAPTSGSATPAEDTKVVAALDIEFQAAVKRNDAAVIAQIQAEDMILVTGRGAIFTRAQHIDAARNQERIYEQQDEEPGTQTVRVWGDTAAGWKYVFGQASLPLPKETP